MPLAAHKLLVSYVLINFRVIGRSKVVYKSGFVS